MQKLIVVILALLLLISSGCTNQEEQKVRKAVEDYNQKLIQVMANGKIDELNTVALEQEVRRIQLFLTFLNDEHKIMNADLLEFKIIDIKPATSKTKDGKNSFLYYEVKTEELWEYTYLDAKTYAVKDDPSKIKYKTTYDVVQPTGKEDWLVYKVIFLEEPFK